MKIQKRCFETLGLLLAIFWNQITGINCLNIKWKKTFNWLILVLYSVANNILLVFHLQIWCVNAMFMHVHLPQSFFPFLFLFCLFAFLSFQCSLMGIYQTSRTRPKRRDPCEYCEQQDLRPDGIFLGLVVVAIQIDLHEMPYWAAAFVFPTFFLLFFLFSRSSASCWDGSYRATEQLPLWGSGRTFGHRNFCLKVFNLI